VIARAVRWADERLGSSPLIKKTLRYAFPDHWSFLLGEIALYAFMFLVATGIYLTFFFDPSHSRTIYHGSYAPLQGLPVSKAYESTVNLSLDVPAGLLIRQAHHWAALLFLVAIVLHLVRIVFTGAFRKPRDVNYYIGVTLLGLGIFEGFAGYSLPDDLMSGMGLAIAYAVALSIPVIGVKFAFLVWGGVFPGSSSFIPRLYIVHVLIVPVVIATLIAIHLAVIVRQHHSQFRGPGRTERNVVGTPLWPGYALRSIGLLLAVGATLFLLGGLVQINPIWQWGPYEPGLSTSGAQPDWYVGWLIGALRLMPNWEPHVGGYTLIPNPFFGGALFPTVVFLLLYAWPSIERRVTGDRLRHDLLDRPRDNPWRSGVAAGFLTWVFVIFFAGSMDRLFFRAGFPYESQVWFFRIAALVLPFVAYRLVRRICEELKAREEHPLRGSGAVSVRRTSDGGFEATRIPQQ
jgi:ubiquinol-cytochrome c reductase cytochrome b subunit